MRRPRRTARTVVVAAVVVVLVAAGATAWALTAGSGPSYRTATAARGSVQQTLSATGTLSPVRLASESFQVAGTVRKVKVKVGQHVRAGQALAGLETSSLETTLRDAKSTLASAQTRLTDAENGQADTTEGAAGTGTGTGATFDSARRVVVTATASARPTGPPTGSRGGGGISADQAAILRDQHAVDAALAAAQTALTTERSACASGTSGSSTASPTPTPTPTPTSSSGMTCDDAAAALLADQTTVNRDEASVDQAELTLTRALSAAASAQSKSSQGKTGSRGSSSTGSTGRSNLGGSTTTITAADLAADQAAIDQAQAQVVTAKSDLAQATLHSAITGKVVAVTVAKGDSVSSGSSTPAVEVVGPGQDQVTIDLSDTQIRHVRIGMTASVTPDGASTPQAGTVVAIQAGGTESSTGSISYPVTITVPTRPGLVNGAAAAVTVIVDQVDNVLTVPTSAVHRSGTKAYVEVLTAGAEAQRTVTIGAVGAARTQIISGIASGQRVVLANLDASVPSSSSNLPIGGGGNFRRFAVNGGGAGGGTFSGGTFSGGTNGGGFGGGGQFSGGAPTGGG